MRKVGWNVAASATLFATGGLLIWRNFDVRDPWLFLGLTVLAIGGHTFISGLTALRGRSLDEEFDAGYRAGYRAGRRAPQVSSVASLDKHRLRERLPAARLNGHGLRRRQRV